MKAAVFRAVGQPLVIETVPDPEPVEGEVIIKVGRCGVCGTDLHATGGHGMTLAPGARLGHEYAGDVVAVGPGVDRFKVGDRLAGMPQVGCGHCEYCQTGIEVLCKSRRANSGALAEYLSVKTRGAVKLPKTLSLADGALIEPLAVGRRAVRLTTPAPDTKVLVMGPGPIGLGVVFWLRRAGVRNIAVLASSTRRQALAEQMGADHFILEGEGAAAEIEQALGGPPALIYDAAGMPGVIARAIELVRPQGAILTLGFCMTPDQFIPGQALFKDVNIRFSMTYSKEDYADCAAALDEDGERARAMISRTVSLADFPAAFEDLRQGRGNVCKLQMDPWMDA